MALSAGCGERSGTLSPPPGIAAWRPGQEEIVAEALALFDAGRRLVMLDLPTGVGKGPISAGVAHNLGGLTTYTSTTKMLQREIERRIDGSVRLVGRANYPSFFAPRLGCDRCTDRGLCPDPKHNNGIERCTYKLAKAAALASPLAVLNTHYLVAETNHVGTFCGRDLVVLDEGEAVEGVIRGAATVEIGQARIRKLGLEPPRDNAGTGDVLAWVHCQLSPELRGATERCKIVLGRTPDSDAIARDLRSFEQLGHAIRLQAQVGGDQLVGHVTGRGSVVLEPVVAAPYGPSMLWRHAGRFLLASGSLIDPDLVAADLGWKGSFGVVSRPSPFPAERRPIRFTPVGSMSASNERITMPAMVARIGEILAAHPGQRGLIHAVSYDRAARLAEALDDPRVILAARQVDVPPDSDGDRPDVDLERFMATPGAVLVSARHERGVSLDDDLCRFIICVKKPLAMWNDPRVMARVALPDGNAWYHGVEPARRLLQMTGRGNRHTADRCVTYLLDNDLGPLLRSGALPEWWQAALAR